jgi:GH43 family beta-xylosidase
MTEPPDATAPAITRPAPEGDDMSSSIRALPRTTWLPLALATLVAGLLVTASSAQAVPARTPPLTTTPWTSQALAGTPLPDAVAAAGSFRNPVGTGPDPFLTVFNGSYYLAMSENDSIKIRRANSVAKLLTAPATEVWRDSNTARNRNVWAPEFYRVGNRWYLYYTADNGVDENHRLYVLESTGDDPMGPYTFKARLVPPNSDVFAIDAALLQHNGRMYVMWSGVNQFQHNGLNIAPLSNPWTISGDRVAINAGGHCPEVREGPAFLYRNGRTWMTYSVCDTGKPDYGLWMMSIAATADPLQPGNWQQHNGAVFSRQDARGVFGPGHHGFFTSPDGTEDWIVYHAKTTSTFTYADRTTRVQKISFNSDGSPNLGQPPAVGATQDLPSGDPGPSTGWINNDNRSSGVGSITYSGTWNSGSTCGVQCFWDDDSYSNTAGATATYSFTGTQLALLSVRDIGNGIAAISVDGGPEQRVDYYGVRTYAGAAPQAIRVGEAVNFITPRLSNGPHTVRVRVTGEKNAASNNTFISIDRAEVWTD